MNKIENKCGVYRIVNIKNGMRYYGSTKDLRQRRHNHKSLMRKGTHQNPGIREDAAIHGEGSFEFEVLCYCKPQERKRLEGVLIDQNLGEECYNRHDSNGSYEATEEHRRKNSNHKKSEEHKANMRKPKRKVACPHCGLVGGGGAMKRWHFDNCANKNGEGVKILRPR